MQRRFLCAFLLIASPCLAEDTLEGRPAFSEAERPPQRVAACDELRAMAEGLEPSELRIDLAIAGKLTLVKGDGALWYLVMCPDLRVMCVTYESNDMKVGDTVLFRGGYTRLDENHAVLDPCLANSGSELR
jgi:hypothetical protein